MNNTTWREETDATRLTKAAFMQAPGEYRLLELPHPVTKAELLALCLGRPESAYRLYLACDMRMTPESVLCSDLFEMPWNRRFPELADDEDSAGVHAPPSSLPGVMGATR